MRKCFPSIRSTNYLLISGHIIVTKQNRSSLAAILSLLGWPLLGGVLLSVGFYFGVNLCKSAFLNRYFAGHPVEYVETCLFFVGAVALIMRLSSVVRQFGAFSVVQFADRPPSGQKLSDIPNILDAIAHMPSKLQNTYLVRRLHAVLDHVLRTNSAQEVDTELKHLAELDADQQHDGYSLVRIIIWATPMLGFLGTVIGITMALGDLSPAALVNTPESAMQGLLGGLSVAFDTTALALSLSMVLMFSMFIVNQIETQLLSAVDVQLRRDLVGRFKVPQMDDDPNVAKIRRMSEDVVQCTEKLVDRQIDLWQSAFERIQENWQQTLNTSGDRLHDTLSDTLEDSVQSHAARLTHNEEVAAQLAEQRWAQLQTTLTRNADALQQQQGEIARQTDVLSSAVQLLANLLTTEHAAPHDDGQRSTVNLYQSEQPTERAA